MNFITDHWTGVIALFALMASIASVIISFCNFRLQRKHNFKLVTPMLHVGQWDYENRLIVTLKNVGTGIALVEKMTVYNLESEARTSIYHWLPSTLPDEMNYKDYWTPNEGFVVQVGEIIKLIELPIDTTNSQQKKIRQMIRQTLGQLTVEIQYEDIYENKMPIKRIQLSYFLRLDNEN